MSARPLHWWQYLVPTYGNWGGPGWCGGEYVDDPAKVRWWMEPMDLMDALFKTHDRLVQIGSPEAHAWLWRALESMDPPECWGLWPRCYRLAAIGIFWIMAGGW